MPRKKTAHRTSDILQKKEEMEATIRLLESSLLERKDEVTAKKDHLLLVEAKLAVAREQSSKAAETYSVLSKSFYLVFFFFLVGGGEERIVY